MYYCSKCTIPLVQQGFIVEEIGKEIVKESFRHPHAARLTDCRYRLEQVKKNTECILIQMKEKEDQELSRLDQYYSLIFDFLERQRKTERKRIQDYYREVFLLLFRKMLTLKIIQDKSPVISNQWTL